MRLEYGAVILLHHMPNQKSELVCCMIINASIWLIFFLGILDQGDGVLVIFDETPTDKTYEMALDTIQNMGKVVDALYLKAKKLT